jgi:nucleotide-binding universal stress UspA family protein
MFKKVIWATDGSDAADLALPYAKALAEEGDRNLVVAHVRELLVGRAGGQPAHADEDELVEKIRGQVKELREAGFDSPLRLATSATAGPAHALAEIAREVDADVIVVGTRGQAPVAGLLLGSLTQRLLHVAPCPVLAVPPTGAAHEPGSEREAVEAAH